MDQTRGRGTLCLKHQQGPPHWPMADNFFNSKTDLFPVNMPVQNFDLFSSETISFFYMRHLLFTMSFGSDKQRKAATLNYTFVDTVFVVFPIHWIPSNLVTVSSILSF